VKRTCNRCRRDTDQTLIVYPGGSEWHCPGCGRTSGRHRRGHPVIAGTALAIAGYALVMLLLVALAFFVNSR
jgi:hypothetical protein